MDTVFYTAFYALSLSGIILFNLSLASMLFFGKMLIPLWITVIYAALAVLWALFSLYHGRRADHQAEGMAFNDAFNRPLVFRSTRIFSSLKRLVGLDGVFFIAFFGISVFLSGSVWPAFLFWGGWVVWFDLFGVQGKEKLDWVKLALMGGAVSGALLLFFLIPPLSARWMFGLGLYALFLLIVVLVGSAFSDALLETSNGASANQTLWAYLWTFLKRNSLFAGPWLALSAFVLTLTIAVYWVFLNGIWPLIAQSLTAVLGWMTGDHRLPDFGANTPFINENEPALRGDEGNDEMRLETYDFLWARIAVKIMRSLPEVLIILTIFACVAYVIYKRKAHDLFSTAESSPQEMGLREERRTLAFENKNVEEFWGRWNIFKKRRAEPPLMEPLRVEIRNMLDDMLALQTWYPGLTVRELARRGILADDTAEIYETVRYGAIPVDTARLNRAIDDVRRARRKLRQEERQV